MFRKIPAQDPPSFERVRLAQPAPLVAANAGILAPMEADRAKACKRGVRFMIGASCRGREREKTMGVGVGLRPAPPGKKGARNMQKLCKILCKCASKSWGDAGTEMNLFRAKGRAFRSNLGFGTVLESG